MIHAILVYIVVPFTTIASASVNETHHRGDTANLICNSLGGPNNTYQWQANGTDIPEETMEMLNLPDVDASTGGIYTCVVANAAGNDADSTFLFIAPYFIIEPVSEETQNGSSVTFQCVAEAFPSPSYQWARTDGAPIREDVVTTTILLNFSPVVFGNEGDYYCNATSRDQVAHSMDFTLAGNQ